MLMSLSNSEIINWVEAHEVRDALEGIPETDAIYDFAVNERAELVRTAIGVALVDRIETAQNDVFVATTALEGLGVGNDKLEAVDESDIIIDEKDFRSVVVSLGKGHTSADSRLWFILKRSLPAEAFGSSKTYPQNPKVGLKLSALRQAIDSGDLGKTSNVGVTTLHLAENILSAMSPVQD
jgi:hypothetical protein